MSTALVVVRSGPADERGWLGLRLALALGLGGRRVHVHLAGPAAAWASPGLQARPWLGGDPGSDLDGLVAETGAVVTVDADAAATLDGLRPGVEPLDAAGLQRLGAAADLVVPV